MNIFMIKVFYEMSKLSNVLIVLPFNLGETLVMNKSVQSFLPKIWHNSPSNLNLFGYEMHLTDTSTHDIQNIC